MDIGATSRDVRAKFHKTDFLRFNLCEIRDQSVFSGVHLCPSFFASRRGRVLNGLCTLKLKTLFLRHLRAIRRCAPASVEFTRYFPPPIDTRVIKLAGKAGQKGKMKIGSNQQARRSNREAAGATPARRSPARIRANSCNSRKAPPSFPSVYCD